MRIGFTGSRNGMTSQQLAKDRAIVEGIDGCVPARLLPELLRELNHHVSECPAINSRIPARVGGIHVF